jgi:hypothetical protein
MGIIAACNNTHLQVDGGDICNLQVNDGDITWPNFLFGSCYISCLKVVPQEASAMMALLV